MQRRGFIGSGLILAGSSLIPDKLLGLENIGKVKDIIVEKPVEGANLKLSKYPSGEFIGEYITDSNGNYTPNLTHVKSTAWADVKRMFSGIPQKREKPAESLNIVRAEITHPDYHNAVRYFDLKKGNLDTKITNRNFDMEFFDAWARGGKKALKRWNTNPKFYINTTNAEQNQIDLVEEIINIDLVEFTNGFLNARIEKINEDREERGSILVQWLLNSTDYYQNHRETIENNEIVFASTWFSKTNKLRRIYLRQLTQVLGLVNSPSSREFYTNDGKYTSQGLDCGKFLYFSKIGSISPDTEPIPE